MAQRTVGLATAAVAALAIVANLAAFGLLGGVIMLAIEASALVFVVLGVVVVRHLLDRRP